MRPPDPAQYESFAVAYEEHAASGPHNVLYDRPAVLDLVGDVENRRVLDAGCGPGALAAELVARGATVLACDASPTLVDLARENVGDGVELRVHSLEEPLDWIADGSVDVVVAALVLHYLTDRATFLAEARRVLTSDGVFVLSTHHPAADWRELGGSYFAVEPVTTTWSKGWEVTAWRRPLGHMTAEFSDAGFVIDRLVEPSPDPAMAESHPRTFARLGEEPNFIAFRLLKRASS